MNDMFGLKGKLWVMFFFVDRRGFIQLSLLVNKKETPRFAVGFRNQLLYFLTMGNGIW